MPINIRTCSEVCTLGYRVSKIDVLQSFLFQEYWDLVKKTMDSFMSGPAHLNLEKRYTGSVSVLYRSLWSQPSITLIPGWRDVNKKYPTSLLRLPADVLAVGCEVWCRKLEGGAKEWTRGVERILMALDDVFVCLLHTLLIDVPPIPLWIYRPMQELFPSSKPSLLPEKRQWH